MANKYITSPESLVTSKEQTENAFINVVKEKQKNLDNVCIEVKKVRCALDKIKTVNELKKCKELKNKNIIYDYTCCDKWTDKNVVKKIAVNYCQDLIIDRELVHLNPGCSIVIL